MASVGAVGIDLICMPLGAGSAHCVPWSGRLYEALDAAVDGRPRQLLLHSALELRDGAAAYVIEMAPVRACGDAMAERRTGTGVTQQAGSG